MKLRWKILIAVGIFLVLIAASLTVTVHIQPQSEVEAYKKSLRDRGEKLELSEMTPRPPAPEDNSADAVEDAFRMLGSGDEKILNAMTMVAPGKALIGWSQPDARGSDFTNSWDGFATMAEADAPAIDLLHQVLVRPKLDFQLDYTKDFSKLETHFVPMRRSARKLGTAAVLDLHHDSPGGAATNILTMLVLVHKDATEGLLISYMVRMGMISTAIPPTWELLQSTNVTDEELAAVQNGWSQLNFLSDAEYAFEIERAWSSTIIQKARASHDDFKGLFDLATMTSSSGGGADWAEVLEDITKGPRSVIAETMWRSSWSYSEELRDMKRDQFILETLRVMQTNQSRFYKLDYDAMWPRLPTIGVTNAGENFFRALRIPDCGDEFGDWGLNETLRETLQFEAARNIVVTAIGLKRFQLKYGKWPGTLGELVPGFIPSIPVDPFDGKPVKYRPTVDNLFLLYCVGEDGKDDGGDPTNSVSSSSSYYWLNEEARDWVWPRPATSAEVQSYYEHPPK